MSPTKPQGEVTTVAGGGSGFAADPKLVKRQLEIRENGEWVGFIAGLIEEKIRNSISTLENVFPNSPAIQLAISKLEKDADLISKTPPKTIDGFLGIEGRVASHYFRCWNSFPLKWKNAGKHTIPEDWRRIGSRKSAFKKKGSNKRAVHPVNAMLNYGYAILESQVKERVIAEGFDPTIGYLHADQPGRPALVLDLMEPVRPSVDLNVLRFAERQRFSPADFAIQSSGVCRLSPSLAAQVARECITSLHFASFELLSPR
jgi:CRISP-associated protein Cas1